jgi:hypothetical protein
MINITVIYDPISGLPMSDYYIDKFCDLLEDKSVICVSNETVICELRARHKEKRLNITKLIYRKFTKEIILDINEYGRLAKWPQGFCDYTDKALERLLKPPFRKESKFNANNN